MRALFHKAHKKMAAVAQSSCFFVIRKIAGYNTTSGIDTREKREVSVDFQPSSMRFGFERPDGDGNVDIMVEWQPDKGGWVLYLWGENNGNDPDMKVIIPDGMDPMLRYATFNPFITKDQSI